MRRGTSPCCGGSRTRALSKVYRAAPLPHAMCARATSSRKLTRVKAEQRRITGHKRADGFVVRVGGFAVYASAASGESEAALRRDLAAVPAVAWQQERATLRANQERQAKMRRFRLHRAAYLADLEARWAQLTEPP